MFEEWFCLHRRLRDGMLDGLRAAFDILYKCWLVCDRQRASANAKLQVESALWSASNYANSVLPTPRVEAEECSTVAVANFRPWPVGSIL